MVMLPSDPAPITPIKPTDLRGILTYVPQFRDHVFVIAIDGSVVDDENFPNVLTDIAVLRSLNIKVVLVHGIGRQIKRLAGERSVVITDAYGGGTTDAPTLKLAIETSALVGHAIMQGLTQNGLKCAITNAVRATEVGVVKGRDQGFTGKIEKIDLSLLQNMIQDEVIPIVSPVACNREGKTLRVNSDLLAAELAIRLKASKLIYLTPHPGLIIKGEVAVNIPLEELEAALKSSSKTIDERLRSKALYAARSLEAGTQRAHILDGRVFGGLLTEIFDKVGLGTMIHANDYQQIRKARPKDAQSIYNITKNAVKTEVLKPRTLQGIERDIERFFVYEIDESIIGCACLIPYPDESTIELASVYVLPFYQGKGVGRKLVEFAIREATRRKADKLIALTTQTYPFFRNVNGFEDGTVQDLPASRREDYEKNNRNSRILIKRL